MNWSNLQDVLLWLTGVGAPAVVMYLLSLLAENWPKWSTFPHAVKFLTPMILSVLIAFGASELLKFPDVVATIQPWFQVVVTAVLAYLSSQQAYMKTLATRYGSRFAHPKSIMKG